jgi:serine/threonine-protein kinase HipA
MPKATIKFSPVFDIVSTTPYLPNDTMALSLTGSKRWPKQEVLL